MAEGLIRAAKIPVGARVLTSALSMITVCVLAVCLVRRIQCVKNWSRLPIVSWLILAIYADSLLFIFSTGILSKSWSINDSTTLCQATILLCLAFYFSTKLGTYYFLVEKVYIVRGSTKKRSKDKLWLFNMFGVILPLAVFIVVLYIYRIGFINSQGVCIVGLQRRVLFPLIGFDLVLNVWLTALFLHPLYQLVSFRKRGNPALRTVAIRTFVGSCVTMVSSLVNFIVLASLNGEPGWICLMLCNLDILFSVLVLHWATSVDKQTTGNAGYRSTIHLTNGLSGIREINDTTQAVNRTTATNASRIVAECDGELGVNECEKDITVVIDGESKDPEVTEVIQECKQSDEKVASQEIKTTHWEDDKR